MAIWHSTRGLSITLIIGIRGMNEECSEEEKKNLNWKFKLIIKKNLRVEGKVDRDEGSGEEIIVHPSVPMTYGLIIFRWQFFCAYFELVNRSFG